MSAGRKIEDEGDALRCLRAAERSGLSAGEWARAHGVDGRSLGAWQMNIARRSAPVRRRAARSVPGATAHALVELVPSAASSTRGGGRYVLMLGDARVEFGDDASLATLRLVLEALRSC